MNPPIEPIIAYKSRDGKLWYSYEDAMNHHQKLWEEKLDSFVTARYVSPPDWEKNPIKVKVQIMEFLVKYRTTLLKLLAELSLDIDDN